ncbi:phage integrase N-terminal SAM-like domain-containing protein [Nostoc sp. LPT]|uniref:phage integrase N-terminal SAM-like domain-containing protein n=1 Tax=Nostoc sp. LPT TaxID=2815387 RepID=UPI003453B162
MGSTEIETFLTHLAVNENVAASTQNQALHAVIIRKRSPSDFNLAIASQYCLILNREVLLFILSAKFF